MVGECNWIPVSCVSSESGSPIRLHAKGECDDAIFVWISNSVPIYRGVFVCVYFILQAIITCACLCEGALDVWWVCNISKERFLTWWCVHRMGAVRAGIVGFDWADWASRGLAVMLTIGLRVLKWLKCLSCHWYARGCAFYYFTFFL